jgi:hypothetical protein
LVALQCSHLEPRFDPNRVLTIDRALPVFSTV